MNFVAGVDAHKETHTVVFPDQVGRFVQSITISADPRGYEKAMAAAHNLCGTVVWGLESTGCYSNPFARRLLSEGAEVYEVPAPSRNDTANGRVALGNPIGSMHKRSRKRSFAKAIAYRDM